MFNKVGRFGGHDILGFTTKTSKGCYATIYCPICEQFKNADDHGLGDKQAIAVALNKVIGHMKVDHKIINDKD